MSFGPLDLPAIKGQKDKAGEFGAEIILQSHFGFARIFLDTGFSCKAQIHMGSQVYGLSGDRRSISYHGNSLESKVMILSNLQLTTSGTKSNFALSFRKFG
ncbi:MAG: hypothetical protein ACLP51_20655 [Syntrophobacteraceae bacterium]